MKGSEYAMRVAAFTLPAAHGGGGSHSSPDNEQVELLRLNQPGAKTGGGATCYM